MLLLCVLFNQFVDYDSDEYIVLGLPELYDDPAYMGHFCNDGAALGLEKGGVDVAAYILASDARKNAAHTDIVGLHMATVAIRAIRKGEEVLVSYGPDYWLEHVARTAASSDGFWGTSDEPLSRKDAGRGNSVHKKPPRK